MVLKKWYYYKVYGLKIKSDIEIPQLIESEDLNYDINICIGIAPFNISRQIEQGRNLYLNFKEIWFNIKSVGTYILYDGNTVVIDKDRNADIEDIKAYLLGSALGLLLFQRNTLALHGGTIVINDKTLTIVGEAGAGKSSLANALRLYNHPFLADDVSVINDNFMINPSYPQQKLCKDTMLKLGYDLSKFEKVNDDREKYRVYVNENFKFKPVKIGAICEIKIENNRSVEIEEIKGKEKLISLINNIYRIELIKKAGMPKEYFKKCLAIAKNIKFYRIYRPKDKYTINEQVELLKNILGI